MSTVDISTGESKKCVKPSPIPRLCTDRPAGLPFGPYEPSRLVYVYRRGDGAGNPERAKYIRTIMDELTRIASHLLFWSTFCMDLGALTAFFYGFRDRKRSWTCSKKPVGAADSELQLHRRSHGRHPSESDHKDQRFHPIPAPYAKRISWCFHR